MSPETDDLSIPSLDPDPVIDAFKPGVDRTLLRRNLKLSVEERLRNLMALGRAAEALRAAGVRARSRG